MKRKRLLITTLLVTSLVTVALLLWLFNSDLGRFQDAIETRLSALLERETTFSTLSLELGWPTRVAASGLVISNADWAGPEPFLEVARIDATVDFWSLLDKGPVIVETLNIEGAQLLLAWNEAGEANYPLAESGPDQGGTSGDARTPTLVPQAPVLFRKARLTDSGLRTRRPDHENHAELAQLTLGEDETGMVALTLQGQLNDRPLGFDGSVGPFEELLIAGAVRATGRGTLDDLTLQGELAFEHLAKPERPRMDVQLTGPDMAALEGLLGLPASRPGPFQLTLKAAPDDQQWTFSFSALAGGARVQVNGRSIALQDYSEASGRLQASGPDLGQLLALLDMEKAPAQPFTVDAQLTRNGSVLVAEDASVTVGDARLALQGTMSNFPSLGDSELGLSIRGPEIEPFREMLSLPGAAAGPFELSFEIRPGDGATELLNLQLKNNLLNATARGTLNDDPNYLGSEVRLSISGNAASAALEPLGLPGLEAQPFTLDAILTLEADRVLVAEGLITGLYHADITLDGSIGHAPRGGATQLELGINGADLQRSLGALDIPWPALLEPSAGQKSGVAAGQQEARSGALPFAIGGQLKLLPKGLQLERVNGNADHLSLTAEGFVPLDDTLDGMNLAISAQGADLRAVLPRLGGFEPARAPFRLDFSIAQQDGQWRFAPSTIELEQARFDLSGTFDRLPDFDATDLELALNAPDLASLGHWQDEPLPAADLALRGQLTGSPQQLQLQDFSFGTAGTTLQGGLLLDIAGARPRLTVELNAERLDIRALLGGETEPGPETGAEAGGTTEQASQPAADPRAAADDGRLIPDAPLPIEWLTDYEGSLDLSIDHLLMPNRQLNGFRIGARLEDGTLDLHRLHSRGLLGAVSGRGQLRALPSGQTLAELSLDATDLVLDREDWRQAEPGTLPEIDASVRMTAAGDSLRSLAASLDGQLMLVATEGQLPGAGLGALNSYLLDQVLRTLVPGMNASNLTTLRCVAARLVAENGRIESQPVVAMRTDKLLIMGSGNVDLATETLEMDFQTTPTKLIGASLMELVNPFVRFEGTLKEIKPVIDPTGTLVYSGMAAATAGLSIVAKGLWDRLKGSSQPCERFRDELNAAMGDLNALPAEP